MSYDLGLYKDGSAVIVDRHEEGGTYAIGGTNEATLNITYNYSAHYYRELDPREGLRWLYGKSGAETVGPLEAAVEMLGMEVYRGPFHVVNIDVALDDDLSPSYKRLLKEIQGVDLEKPENAELLARAQHRGLLNNTGGYWKPTPGNAGHALSILLSWAKQHPDAVWEGD